MERLRKALHAVQKGLRLQRPLRRRAVKRMKKRHAEQVKFENQADAAAEAADRLRSKGHIAKAERKSKKVFRLETKANRAARKAIIWKGRAKKITQRIENLDTRKEAIENDIRVLEAEASGKLKFDVDANKVTGGTPQQRVKGAALLAAKRCSEGKRANFYSQPGSYSVNRVFTGEPRGYRSDCSQFLTSCHWAADLPDPNGEEWTGGYTGTQVREGIEISESNLKPGDYIIYGSGVGYHVEIYVGNGKTIGHGSAPIDPGVIDLFGDGDYRCFRPKALA